ncbi:MAG: hypothetical protein ACK55I_37060, partial [bacterium]
MGGFWRRLPEARCVRQHGRRRPDLVVDVGRRVVAPVAVVVLEGEVLVAVAAVEGVVAQRRVEQALVAVRALARSRVGRVLAVVDHVGVLVEADAPVLEHGAVRALVATHAGAIRDAADEAAAVREQLGHVADLVGV